MDPEEFKRKQDARILAHWNATKGMGPILPTEPIGDADLERLQRQAEVRAAAFWDEEEAADLCDGDLRPVDHALIDSIEANAEAYVFRNKKRYFPEGYDVYLQTPHWRALRERMLKRAGGYCMRCRLRRGRLEVHHLTYRNLGHERESDLLVLCRECHQSEHSADAEAASAR